MVITPMIGTISSQAPKGQLDLWRRSRDRMVGRWLQLQLLKVRSVRRESGVTSTAREEKGAIFRVERLFAGFGCMGFVS